MDKKTLSNTPGDRLHEIRKALQLNQYDFAKRLGLNSSTICNYEKNRRTIPEAVMHLVCKEYFIDYNFLRYGQGDMFVKTSDDTLEALAIQYNLNTSDVSVIKEFIRLSPEDRSAVIAFMKVLAKKIP